MRRVTETGNPSCHAQGESRRAQRGKAATARRPDQHAEKPPEASGLHQPVQGDVDKHALDFRERLQQRGQQK